jgi:V/A-type H+-transporting ATPase subunit G/H
MSVDILKDIASVEETAEQIETQAIQKSRDIIAAAKKEASSVAEKSAEQAEGKAGDVIRSYEEKARKEIENIKAHILSQCDEIRKCSGEKLNEAVDFIIERIVKLQ